MGLFSNEINTFRNKWTFHYKAETLLPYVLAKYKSLQQAETDARNQMAALLTNPDVKATDQRIADLKHAISFNSAEKEKCHILYHELNRARFDDKLFELGIGDVSYFDIHLNTRME